MSERIAELESQLSNALEPLDQLEVLTELSRALVYSDPARSKEYIEKALEIARLFLERGLHRVEASRAFYAAALHAEVRSDYAEVEDLLTPALAIFERYRAFEDAGRTLNLLGVIHEALGVYNQAQTYFERAEKIFESLEDASGLAQARNGLAGILRNRGKLTEALEAYQRNGRTALTHGDQAGHADALTGEGTCHREFGNFPASLAAHAQSMRIREALDDRYHLAHSLSSIGSVHFALGNHDEAIRYYNEALAIEEPLGDRRAIAGDQINLGGIHYYRREYDTAWTYLERGVHIAEEIGNRNFYSNGLGMMAQVAVARGDAERGITIAERAIAVKEELGDTRGICYGKFTLAQACAEHGDIDRAIDVARDAATLAEQIGARPGFANACSILTSMYRAKGRHAQALEWFEKYHQINEAMLRAEAEGKLEQLTAAHERENAEKREELLRIENERIERELELKQKHLTTMAMSIVQHGNIIRTIQDSLGEALKATGETRTHKLRELRKQITHQSPTSETWRQFERQLENLHPEFLTTLARTYPQLSPTERKICALIRVGLGSKEMATILCVTVRSVETYRLRVRKKLQLGSDRNLSNELARLSPELRGVS